MESPALVALLSSISQLIVLLLLSPANSPDSNSRANAFPLLQNFLSSHDMAAAATALSLLTLSRKRRRTHFSHRDSEPTHLDIDPELGVPAPVQPGLTRSPDSFKNCFRMTSSTFEWLCGLLEPLLECRDPVGLPLNLPAELRLGIGLFRLSTGSDYPEISVQFGVSESVARFCAKQLCRVICTNYRFWIEFPNPNELRSVSSVFENRTGLPNCCGVIDCTRFKIVKDDVFEENIAAQITVDSSCRILSIVAGFRGDKDDWRVLKSSTLYKDIEAGRLLDSPAVNVNGVTVNQYVIGDGGYPLLPWLMVPFVGDVVKGSEEEHFNAAHKEMRLLGHRTIVSLKGWGVLSKPIREEFKMAVAYIGACSILHNGLLRREDYSALCDGLDDDYSSYDQSSRLYRDTSLEENDIERKALVIRSALATKAKAFQSSKF